MLRAISLKQIFLASAILFLVSTFAIALLMFQNEAQFDRNNETLDEILRRQRRRQDDQQRKVELTTLQWQLNDEQTSNFQQYDMTTTEFAFESSTSTSDETPLATQPPPNDYFDETKRKTNDYQQNQWQNDNANNVAPKQIVLLAMHHSGTSLLARIIMEMGAYGGERDEFKLQGGKNAKKKNPPKFWERQDVIDLNELMVNETLFDSDPGWITGFQFRASNVSMVRQEYFALKLKHIIDDLERRADNHPILLKEPRLSITYPFWRPIMDDNSVCVLIYRHPYLVATGLRKRPRNRGMTLSQWLALWEKYQQGSLNACYNRPRVLVSHDELARDPRSTIDKLQQDLEALGVSNLHRVDDTFLSSFLPPFSPPPLDPAFNEALSSTQLQLWRAFDERRALNEELGSDAIDVLTDEELQLLQTMATPAHSEQAFETALSSVAYFGTVVIIPSNSFFADLARNQVCSLRRLDLPFKPLLLGMDDHFCDAVYGAATPCYYDKEFGVGVANHQRWTLSGSSQYFRILQLKMSYVEQAIERGYDVLLADADIVWRRDALSAVKQLEEKDLWIQSDARPANEEKKNWICAGFFYMKR